jgi:hypothetical protein
MSKAMKVLSLTFIILSTSLSAAGADSLETTVLQKDKQFWQAYNTCNVNEIRNYFTDDMEFYHDKSGLTSSLEAFMKSISENLCGANNPKLQRKPIEDSIKVFPLNNYGAIISGKHTFYRVENGHQILDGVAQFTHIWRHRDGVWKMSRVLSYDHQAPSESMLTTQIQLSDETLSSYAGKYQAPNTGTVIISINENQLNMQAGKMNADLYPETETLFRHAEAPLTFEFVKNEKQDVIKMIVRENGEVVEEARRLK